MKNALTTLIEVALVGIISAMGTLAFACIFSTDAREVFGKIMLSVITLHNMF
jgi:hypothetical protein